MPRSPKDRFNKALLGCGVPVLIGVAIVSHHLRGRFAGPFPVVMGPPYFVYQMDPSDPTCRGDYFVEATAPSDTSCGTCKTPIPKSAPCFEIYLLHTEGDPDSAKELLGYRCTNTSCIDGKRLDSLPPEVLAEGDD